MTNQEAADLLDNLIGMISDNQDSDYDEALKMGIKALSINVREKHGEWIPFSEEISIFRYEGYHCSKCWGIAKDNKDNFCPNCGSYNGGSKSV